METLKQAGYTIMGACSVLGISRSGYYALKYYAMKQPNKCKKSCSSIKDAELIEQIKEIKLNHPFWGYRRVRAWLVHREKIQVGKKKVKAIMKSQGLLATQTVHEAKRTPQRSKPRVVRPRQYWGIDMTKFIIPVVGWVYLVIVLDWYTKKIVGWDISLRSRSAEWRKALEMAINKEFSEGVRGSRLRL